MKKQNIIIIILLIVLGFFGVYIFSTSSEISEPYIDITKEPMEENDTVVEKETEMVEEIMLKMPETAIQYELTDGLVNYVTQKRFLQKTDEEVIGTSDEIFGKGWLNPESGTFYFEAELDFSTLATDSKERDAVVAKLLTDTKVMIKIQVEEEEKLFIGEEFELDIPVMLTINGVERSEIFSVTGLVDENTFTAAGNSEIKMNDFGIEPPSLLEVFSVDDLLELRFEISGKVIS